MLLASLLTTVAALFAWLASRRGPSSNSSARAVAGLCAAGLLILAVAFYNRYLGLAESVYVMLIVLTVVLSALPFLLAMLALLRRRLER